MQNPTSTNISPISERLYALIAEGVGQFEQPRGLGSSSEVTRIDHCQKCVLSKNRKRVVVANKFTPKPFFVLAEFPEPEDETNSTVFSPDGSSSIILNLIDKLEIQDSCHYAFALKCVSSKHIPNDNISVCVLENLRKELALIMPQTIFCFGMRAFLALWRLNDMSSRGLNDVSSRGLNDVSSRGLNDMSSRGVTTGSISLPDENSKLLLTLDHGTIELYVLPTAQELKQFPHWRLPVWSKLAHFKQKKEY